jgi:hypothetical protein
MSSIYNSTEKEYINTVLTDETKLTSLPDIRDRLITLECKTLNYIRNRSKQFYKSSEYQTVLEDPIFLKLVYIKDEIESLMACVKNIFQLLTYSKSERFKARVSMYLQWGMSGRMREDNETCDREVNDTITHIEKYYKARVQAVFCEMLKKELDDELKRLEDMEEGNDFEKMD